MSGIRFQGLRPLIPGTLKSETGGDRGRDQAADFYPAHTFRSTFHHLIAKALDKADVPDVRRNSASRLQIALPAGEAFTISVSGQIASRAPGVAVQRREAFFAPPKAARPRWPWNRIQGTRKGILEAASESGTPETAIAVSCRCLTAASSPVRKAGT